MASRTAIVASRIDGYAALVGDADCGRLVPPADAEAIAAALCPLLDDRSHRRLLGARGAERARQYDWRTIAARLEEIYRRVATCRPCT